MATARFIPGRIEGPDHPLPSVRDRETGEIYVFREEDVTEIAAAWNADPSLAIEPSATSLDAIFTKTSAPT